MTSTERPLPGITEENARYWESARRQALELPRCLQCGEIFYPLTFRCRRCLSSSLTWEPVSGKATLVTWNVMHQIYDAAFKDLVPYIVGVVRLAEGAQMVSNIVDAQPASLTVGMSLQLDYVRLNEDVTLPVYRPSEEVA